PGGLIGIPRARQPFTKIGDGLVGKPEREGLRSCSHAGLDLVGEGRVLSQGAAPRYSAAMLCRVASRCATPTRSALPDPRSGSLSTTIISAGAIKSDAPLALRCAWKAERVAPFFSVT